MAPIQMATNAFYDDNADTDVCLDPDECDQHPMKHTFWSKLPKLKLPRLFLRDDHLELDHNHRLWSKDQQNVPSKNAPNQRPLVGLPRPGTFRRQNSEKADRLVPVELGHAERRASSVSRHRSLCAQKIRSKSSPPSPPPFMPARFSAPAVTESTQLQNDTKRNTEPPPTVEHPTTLGSTDVKPEFLLPPPRRSPSRTSSHDLEESINDDERAQLDQELDSKWILNLSMHFRDKSNREKFFVTYAQEPNHWKRVTVSCDYRDAEPGSLEMDLRELQYQRDKSVQIYDAVRDSLPEIQFYPTVTNLKLETTNERLHVHVTEDVNEIIHYPPRSSVRHILEDTDCPVQEVVESDLIFDSHLSGFVYKVKYCGRDYIKKEIPGPDTVDEFLYEINALHALVGSNSVIRLEAVVLDDSFQTLKGLLISYAERGALVDLLYDHSGNLPWVDRLRWARQAIQGLQEIHNEGYVQGDFTLSNIVIDADNNAKIIDINRRGCPVGWEPPEIAQKIASNQRISMYIGEKSDIYQLGMTLWALAMGEDEPERHDTPLNMDEFPSEVPAWYQQIVRKCLEPQPRHRLSARELLEIFPQLSHTRSRPQLFPRSSTARGTVKRYVEPSIESSAAVEREDIERDNLERLRRRHSLPDNAGGVSLGEETFINPPSSSYRFDSGSSYVGISRRRRPTTNTSYMDDEDENRGRRRHSFHHIEYCKNYDSRLNPTATLSKIDRPLEDIDATENPNRDASQSLALEDLEKSDETLLETPQQEADLSIGQEIFSIPATESTSNIRSNDVQPNHTFSEEEDIDLEADLASFDHFHDPIQQSSLTSGSTPRYPTSQRNDSSQHISRIPPLDMDHAELAGCGANPSLDTSSPLDPSQLSKSRNPKEVRNEPSASREIETQLIPLPEYQSTSPATNPNSLTGEDIEIQPRSSLFAPSITTE